MRFVTIRDMRMDIASVLPKLPREGKGVLTHHGHPIAVVTSADECNLKDTLRIAKNPGYSGRRSYAAQRCKTRCCAVVAPPYCRGSCRRSTGPQAVKIVVDTNILVSGLLSPYGPPGRIASGIAVGTWKVCYSARIMAEHAELLLRPAFGFEPADVVAILRQIKIEGELCAPPSAVIVLPDPDACPFLEAAVATCADYLITGNLRHFAAAVRQGVAVVSPAQFIRQVSQSPH